MKTKIDKIKVVITNPDIPNQYAVILFFPCDNNSPSDGEPTSKPIPKKSKAVKVVIDDATKKGRLAKIIGVVFGKICRKIIHELRAPNAWLALT